MQLYDFILRKEILIISFHSVIQLQYCFILVRVKVDTEPIPRPLDVRDRDTP